MNASLSLSRFGVISRISSARSWVCVGRVHRDHVLVHRQLVAVARRRSSLTSSPSSGTGNIANGPTTELHDENVSVSRYTSFELVVAGDRDDAEVGERRAPGTADAQLVEVRVRVLDQRLVGEEVDRLPVAHASSSVGCCCALAQQC